MNAYRTQVLAALALASGFVPLPPASVRVQPQHMKKPGKPTEEGPLPGLSEENYAVLPAILGIGVISPILLVAQAFLPAPTAAPPKKK